MPKNMQFGLLGFNELLSDEFFNFIVTENENVSFERRI